VVEDYLRVIERTGRRLRGIGVAHLGAGGGLCFRGRDRIAVRFTDPAGDRIVADGRSLWIYLPSTAPDQVIRDKAAYLNTPFFIARQVFYFAVWLGIGALLTKWSAEQDRGIGVTTMDSVRFRTVSAPGLLFLVITLTFASPKLAT
jgi:hypothetical protein